MTIKRIFSRIPLFALLAVFVTSCQTSPVEEGITDHGAQMEETDSNEGSTSCDMVSSELGFDLDTEARNPQPPTFSYTGTLAAYTSLHTVPPYMLGTDCLCKIQKFELEFTDLPLSTLLNLYNDDGVPVPFSPPQFNVSSQTWTVTIGAENLDMGLFVSYNHTDPSPSLVSASGLCMVDNISGPIDGVLLNRPWKRSTIDGLGRQVTEFYVPVETGSLTHSIVVEN